MNANNETPTQDWFAPRLQRGISEKLSRYSRFVELLKRALPLTAVGVLVILFIVPNVTAPTAKPKSASSIDATMRGAHFTSEDKQGRPYEVESPVARQMPDEPGVTDLTTPKAKLDLGNGESIDADAAKAKYDDKTGTLKIDGALTLKKNDGTTFKTDNATIDVNTQNAESKAPAVLQGEFGEVRGEGFKAIDGGKTIIFTGKSSATIKLGGDKAPSPSAPAPSTQGVKP